MPNKNTMNNHIGVLEHENMNQGPYKAFKIHISQMIFKNIKALCFVWFVENWRDVKENWEKYEGCVWLFKKN